MVKGQAKQSDEQERDAHGPLTFTGGIPYATKQSGDFAFAASLPCAGRTRNQTMAGGEKFLIVRRRVATEVAAVVKTEPALRDAVGGGYQGHCCARRPAMRASLIWPASFLMLSFPSGVSAKTPSRWSM